MKESTLPNSYQFGEKTLTFSQVHEQFAATQYGKILSDNVRFGKFIPEDMPNSEWVNLLGADVNNLTHMPLTLGLTRSFLDHCAKAPEDRDEISFTREEQSLLLLTAVVHDQAEAVIGDIPLPQKTKSDEEREMVAFKTVFNASFKDGSDVHDDVADQIMDVLTDTTSKLGRAFNVIENVGYIRTALRAWEQTDGVDGELRTNLNSLTQQVFAFSLAKLIDYSITYPPVKAYLTHHADTITDIFATADERPTPVDRSRFAKAQETWEQFTQMP